MKNDEAGFSLTEMVVSIALLGIISTSLLMALQILSARTIDLQKRTQALMLVQSGLEKVVFENNRNGFDWLQARNFPDEQDAEGLKGFVRSTSFKKLSSTLKEVVVRVSWKGGRKVTALWVRKTK
ncbi:MAG: type II secretion system protein [Calditrichaeota bacterium]|nr:type II secretion system protein [Calditrichota bacterium]